MATLVDDCWAFEFDGFRGYLRGDGHHGVEVTAGPDEEPVTRATNLNLEHYVADGAFGEFVPREHATVTATRSGPESVRVRLDPTDEWPVQATLTMRLLSTPERTVEAEYEFAFREAVEGFEAFVGNYCHDDRPPELRFDAGWTRPDLAPDEHRFWPAAATDPDAIRERYPASMMGLEATVADDPLAAPVLRSAVPDTDRRVVRAIEPDLLASVSANRRFGAHDLSLVGRDVRAGEVVSGRAWLSYRDPGEALAWHERLPPDRSD